MCDETKHISSDGLTDTVVVNFTTVAHNVRLLSAHTLNYAYIKLTRQLRRQ